MSEISDAVATMRKAFKSDPDFARAWHDNVAMCCYDAILSDGGEQLSVAHRVGNDAASRFMKHAFGVVTKGPQG